MARPGSGTEVLLIGRAGRGWAKGPAPPAGQLQQPPPQHPPPDGAGAEAEPVSATVVSSLTVSVCPSGHGAGALDSAIGRWSSNVSVQSRQR